MDTVQPTDIVIRNRYKILQFLGSGSFSDTYIAEDIDLPGNPKCVVKQLKPKTFEQEVMLVTRRLFKCEAEVLYYLGSLRGCLKSCNNYASRLTIKRINVR